MQHEKNSIRGAELIQCVVQLQQRSSFRAVENQCKLCRFHARARPVATAKCVEPKLAPQHARGLTVHQAREALHSPPARRVVERAQHHFLSELSTCARTRQAARKNRKNPRREPLPHRRCRPTFSPEESTAEDGVVHVRRVRVVHEPEVGDTTRTSDQVRLQRFSRAGPAPAECRTDGTFSIIQCPLEALSCQLLRNLSDRKDPLLSKRKRDPAREPPPLSPESLELVRVGRHIRSHSGACVTPPPATYRRG